MINEVKIYEIQFNSEGEKIWIAAHTAIEALQFHESSTEVSLIEFDNNDDIVELPKEKWDEYMVTNPDCDETMTFKEVMENIDAPDWIAGTMFM